MKKIFLSVILILMAGCNQTVNKNGSQRVMSPMGPQKKECSFHWTDKEFIAYYDRLNRNWIQLESAWTKDRDTEKNKKEFLILSSMAMVAALPAGIKVSSIDKAFEKIYVLLFDPGSNKIRQLSMTQLEKINQCRY